MFGSVLLALGTLLHLYVFWRAASVPLVRRRVPRPVLFASGLLLWAAFLAGRTFGHDGSGAWAAALELLGMTSLAGMFLVSASLLPVDLVTGFGLFFRGRAPSLRGWALGIGGVLAGIALFQGNRPPVVEHHRLTLDELPAELDGTVVVALSDLHLGAHLGEEWAAEVVDRVRGLKPDLVVFLGDLFEGHGQPDGDPVAALRRLEAPLGVWAVVGNHDARHGRDPDASLLGRAGFRVLRDRWEEVRPGLVLAGLDDPRARRRSGREGDPWARALTGRPAGATLLLSHRPIHAERAADAGVDLMLSGHTHGGQVWPFGYVVRLETELVAGRYDVEGMPVIVSRGTGTWGPRMRLWKPGEILHITLSSARGPAGGDGLPRGGAAEL